MTTQTGSAELKARWTDEVLRAADLAFAPMDPVAAYRGVPPKHPFVSPFGEHDGLADFRYLPLGVIPANRTIERADLTGATDVRRGQLGQANFVDCVFDSAKMETNLGKSFVRCTFRRANFSRSTLRGAFEECDFTAANFSHCGGTEVSFLRCDFTTTRLTGASLQRGVFDACTWSGAILGNASLAHAVFRRSRPDNAQLAGAMAPAVKFEDIASR